MHRDDKQGKVYVGSVLVARWDPIPQNSYPQNRGGQKVTLAQKAKKVKMTNHKKHLFFKSLKARSRGKTLEIIIARRMQNLVHFENKNIIFVIKIHFDIFRIFG